MSYNLTGLLYPSLLGSIDLTDHKMTKYKISDIKNKTFDKISVSYLSVIKWLILSTISTARYPLSDIKHQKTADIKHQISSTRYVNFRISYIKN